jgi:hypothetical protein
LQATLNHLAQAKGKPILFFLPALELKNWSV